MPVDKPKPGETQDQYLKYCIPAEIQAGKEQDQATAICISTYRKDKMSKLTTSQEKFSAKLKYSQQFRGINLTNFGENSDACWEGYIQVGTKILDGREVPDCRGPVEMEEGVPHYTKDGELYTGPTHKGPDGRLMTGEVHTEDSEYLYHKDEFELLPIIDSSYPGEGAVTGSK
jgi:hypothetical protein